MCFTVFGSFHVFCVSFNIINKKWDEEPTAEKEELKKEEKLEKEKEELEDELKRAEVNEVQDLLWAVISGWV